MTAPWVNPFSGGVKPQEDKKKQEPAPVWRNPFGPVVAQNTQPLEPEDHNIDEPGFFQSLGSTLHFIMKLNNPDIDKPLAEQFRTGLSPITADPSKGIENVKKTFNALMAAGSDMMGIAGKLPLSANPIDVGVSASQPGSYLNQTAQVLGTPGAPAQAGKSIISGLNPVNILKSLPSFISVPFEAISGTKNVNGEPVPATPQEQGVAIEKFVGIALQMTIAGKVTKALTPALEGGAQALAYTERSAIGRGLQNIKPGVVGQSAGGAVYGFSSGIHDDTEVAQSINGILTFAPIGVLAGLVKTPSVTAEARKTVGRLSTDVTPDNAQQVASLRSLQNSPQSNTGKAVANIDAFATADDLVTAAVKSHLDVGDGYVVGGLSPERVTKLKEELSPTEKLAPKNYIPSPEVEQAFNRSSRSNIGGMFPIGMEFADPFDHAAYLARNGVKSKKSGIIALEDLMDQTGLSEAEIKSHGIAVKDFISKQDRAGSPRTALDLEKLNLEVVNKGSARLVTMLEGQKITEPTGKVWTKMGTSITDGQQILSIDSDLAKKIAGRDPNPRIVDPEAPVVFVPKQNFQPEAGRGVYKFNVYEHDKGTLITPFKLNAPTEKFFKDTGFLPNEVVTYSGNEYVLRGSGKVENLSTGEQLDIPSADLIRKPTGVSSEFFKAANGDRIGRVGVLNPETYFNKLYDDFKKEFVMDKVPDKSYADQIINFSKDRGIENQADIRNLQEAFYSRIQKDAVNNLTAEDKVLYDGAKRQLEEWHAEDSKLLGRQLAQQATGNGMYINAEGGGSYTLRDLNSSRTMHTFQTVDEGLKFIKDSKQAVGFDLDGGNTGAVPASSGSIGRMGDRYAGKQENFYSSQWLDNFNAGKFGKYLVPIGNMIASVDRLLESNFSNKVYQTLQTAHNFQKEFISTRARSAFENIQKVESFAKSKGITDPVRLGYVADNIEAMSQKEIINKLLPRPMNALEIAKAAKLSTVDVDRVVDYMYEVKQEAPSANYKSQEFVLSRSKVAAQTVKDAGGNVVPKYAKEVIDKGDEMFGLAQAGPEDVSTYGIIRLAKAIRNPSQAVNRARHAAIVNLSPAEIKLGEMLDDYYKEVGDLFQIPKEARLAGYLPHAKIAQATGYNPWAESMAKDGFARELTRIGLTPDHSLNRDPIQLGRNYLMAGTRTASILPGGRSFISYISDAQKYVQETQEKYLAKTLDDGSPNPEYDAVKASKIGAFTELVNEHIADMNGVPDHSVRLGHAANALSEKLLGGDVSKKALLFTHAAYLGGRLGLTLRDVVNTATNAYGKYGAVFTAKAFGRSFSGDYVKQIVKEGVLTNHSAIDLLLPGEDINNAIGRISKKVDRLGDITMKLNGQALVHMQTAAGIYKATYETVLEHSDKLLKSEESKEKVYTSMKIQTMEPVYQAEFDKLIQAGQVESAAKLLGKYRVKELINVYGANNNPIGWNNAAGRLLGQFGSWGANEAQTVLGAASRGTGYQRTTAALRFSAANAAILGVGYATGLNLGRWLITPFGLYGVGPLVENALAAQDAAVALTSNAPSQQRAAQRTLMRFVPHDEFTLGQMYIPYSYMIQDFVTGANMVDHGFGIAGLAQTVGLPVNKEVRSPLQEFMGEHPKNLKTNKRLK